MSESTDESGNQWLRVTEMPATRTFDFTYRALIRMETAFYRWSAFPDSWPPPPTRFIEPESGIESDAPEVLSLARRISATSPLAVVAETFAIVHRTLNYRLKKKEYGARYAARHGEGDCTEYASLFAALLRAHGIGARLNLGYWENELHAIAEVYLGGLWVPVEITNQHTPLFGLSQNFITLLRANWISLATMAQITSFYYQSPGPCAPHLSTSVKVERAPSYVGVRLLDFPPTLPYPIGLKTARIPVTAHIEKEDELYRLHIKNETDWHLCLKAILAAKYEILRIYPLAIPPRDMVVQEVANRELRGYFRSYSKIAVVLISDADQAQLIGEIERKNLIAILAPADYNR